MPRRQASSMSSQGLTDLQLSSLLLSLVPTAPLPFEDSTLTAQLKAIDPPSVRTVAMDSDSPTTPVASTTQHSPCDDSVILGDLDSSNDGSMSDVEEDQEAFYAVFPQAPTLAKQHALRPLVDAVRQLLARPHHLFAALLPCTLTVGVQDIGVLDRKAHVYTQTQLQTMLSPEAWQRQSDFLERRSTPNDRWTSPQLVQQVDEMMLKLTLHYSQLWTYTCLAAVRKVHTLEWTVCKLHADWTGTTFPSLATGGQGDRATNKLPSLEVTSLYRPLRLRSHTAAAALAAAASAATNAASAAQAHIELSTSKPPSKKAMKTTATRDAASRRARLARQSNEFLIAWFLHHKAKPYPSQAERVHIANKTGLTEQQVRNWFANMRKRHWNPKDEASKTKRPRCLLDTLLRKNEATNASA